VKLTMFDRHLGNSRADRYFSALCTDLGLSYKGKPYDQVFEIRTTDGQSQILGKDEIAHIRLHGRGKQLQHLLDNRDRYLNSIISMGVLHSIKGVNAKITVNYGSFSASVDNGLIESPELSLADDIVIYRKEAVTQLNNKNLAGFARAYRAALHSSVSLIDCVLHRYHFHIFEMLPDANEIYENVATLGSRASVESRLDAWILTFATHKQDGFKKSKNLNDFWALKKARNKVTHPDLPSSIYDLKEVVRVLNLIPTGIGGMLADLRKHSDQTENIGFIQHIKSAPIIRIGN
jgi:hypothetical protein